jgi:hypothetical protein
MSEDILAEVEQEFKAKTAREALLLVASEVRQTRREVGEMKALQGKQNDTVTKNCNRLTHLETVNKVVYGVLAVIGGTLVKIFAE